MSSRQLSEKWDRIPFFGTHAMAATAHVTAGRKWEGAAAELYGYYASAAPARYHFSIHNGNATYS